jgi:hypothetical protein
MRTDNPLRGLLAASFQHRREYHLSARVFEVPNRHLKIKRRKVARDAL